MGSGGIGGLIGARLIEMGADVSFVARGAHLQAMREQGLTVRSAQGDLVLPKVTVSESTAEIGAVDLVIFAVKTYDGEKAAASLGPLMMRSTRVVTLQNGIDSVEMLGRHVSTDQVVGGATYLSAFVSRPGEIVDAGGLPRVLIGGYHDPVIRAFEEIGARAKSLGIRSIEDIDNVLWEKFVILCAFSGGTALTRASIGAIRTDSEAHFFIEQLRDEGVSVALAAGYPLPEDFAPRTREIWARLAPETRSSMAIDLDRGKPIEVAWLSGRMHELGARYGVPTPGHSAVYRALRLHALGNRSAVIEGTS
jgi:2-dehydropantoate 2-reductase